MWTNMVWWKKTVGICSKTIGFGPKWVKILEKKTLTSFSREYVFAGLPHRCGDNSVSFSPNYFKISAIGPNCLFYILFYGTSSTSNWSSFTVFRKYGPKYTIDFSWNNEHIAYLIEQNVLCSFLNILRNFHYLNFNHFLARAGTPKLSIHCWRHGNHMKPQIKCS